MKKKAMAAQRRWNQQQPNYLADVTRPLPPAPAENQGTIKYIARDKSGVFARPKASGGAIHENEGSIKTGNPLAADSSTEEIGDGSGNQ